MDFTGTPDTLFATVSLLLLITGIIFVHLYATQKNHRMLANGIIRSILAISLFGILFSIIARYALDYDELSSALAFYSVLLGIGAHQLLRLSNKIE